jgi:hypothetical protein
MTFLRKLLRISSISAAIALLAGAGLASANVDVSGINDTTGAYSENITRILADRTWAIDWVNNMRTNNLVQSDISTGSNRMSENTTAFGFQTGGVDLTSSTGAPFANRVLDFGFGLNGIGDNLDDVSVVGGNAITGARSENINTVQADRNLTIRLVNNAQINNTSRLAANTGSNDVSRNTTVGNVTTGDVSGRVAFDNGGNINPLSMFDFSGLNNGSVSADFRNGITGFSSVNNNTLDVSSEVNVDLQNNSVVDNQFDTVANTGGNDINENTTVGSVMTGNVVLDLSAAN